MVNKGLVALLTTVGVTAGAVYVVHKGQTTDRERMHRLVRAEIEAERRRKECAENGGPCEYKESRFVGETEEERRKRECAEAGGPCQAKPQPKTA